MDHYFTIYMADLEGFLDLLKKGIHHNEVKIVFGEYFRDVFLKTARHILRQLKKEVFLAMYESFY